MIFLFHIDI